VGDAVGGGSGLRSVSVEHCGGSGIVECVAGVVLCIFVGCRDLLALLDLGNLLLRWIAYRACGGSTMTKISLATTKW
jgi:hypothetical protein